MLQACSRGALLHAASLPHSETLKVRELFDARSCEISSALTNRGCSDPKVILLLLWIGLTVYTSLRLRLETGKKNKQIKKPYRSVDPNQKVVSLRERAQLFVLLVNLKQSDISSFASLVFGLVCFVFSPHVIKQSK